MPYEDQYQKVRISSTTHNGMFLELWDRATDTLVLDAFYSDADGSFEFKRYRLDDSDEVVRWFENEARQLLPPISS